jgi:hypothetical protein
MNRYLPCCLLIAFLVGCQTKPSSQSSGRTLFLGATSDAKGGEFIGEKPTSRPADLCPGDIPSRVRYKSSDDRTVIAAADRLKEALNGSESLIFESSVLVFPGAWSNFRLTGSVGLKDAKPMTHLGNDGSSAAGMYLSNLGELLSLQKYWIQSIKKPAVVRAMTTQELRKWWIYIPFDIEEPIFIVEDADGARKYVVSFGKTGKIGLLDELNFYRG